MQKVKVPLKSGQGAIKKPMGILKGMVRFPEGFPP
jgi:hypothetical protein